MPSTATQSPCTHARTHPPTHAPLCLPGVAESIVVYAKEQRADAVVVGSRGMGALKSSLMSCVGLGSVSSYLVHHLPHGAVIVCRGREAGAAESEARASCGCCGLQAVPCVPAKACRMRCPRRPCDPLCCATCARS